MSTACILIIGNEILSGRTQDSNLNYLAKTLNEKGIKLREARVVADLPEAIIEAVNALRATYDYVFTTGGIGPTHDDITSACIARAFGVPLVRHPEAEALLRRFYPPEQQNDARMKMADVPEGASLIANPVSAAPGFMLGNVYVMAGVPRIMQAMFDGIRHSLAGGRPVLSATVSTFLTEGSIAAGLGEVQGRFADVDIGSYPFMRQGRLGTSLVARGEEAARVEQARSEIETLIRESGGEIVSELAV